MAASWSHCLSLDGRMPAGRKRLDWFGQILRPSGLRMLQPDGSGFSWVPQKRGQLSG